MKFNLTKTVVAGTYEADPRITPPDPADIWDCSDYTNEKPDAPLQLLVSINLPEAVDAAKTVDFSFYVYDDENSLWKELPLALEKVGNNEIEKVGIMPGKIFCRVSGGTVASGNDIEVQAAIHYGYEGEVQLETDNIHVKVEAKIDEEYQFIDEEGSGVAINIAEILVANSELKNIAINFSAAPTTSEDLIIKHVSGAREVVLWKDDPSTLASPTDIIAILSDYNIIAGDMITITFANTDAVDWWVVGAARKHYDL
jgi:hypothetical protein